MSEHESGNTGTREAEVTAASPSAKTLREQGITEEALREALGDDRPAAWIASLLDRTEGELADEPAVLRRLDTARAAAAIARLIAHLDELKVPREHQGRALPIDERLQLLVLHFRVQYDRQDKGILALANAIDMAWALLSGPVVSYPKIGRAAAILKQAGQSIKPRGA